MLAVPSRNESIKSVKPSRDESVNPGCPLNESIKHDRQSCRRRPGERTPSGHTYVSITSDLNHLQYVQKVWNTCSRWPTSCARRRPCRAVLFGRYVCTPMMPGLRWPGQTSWVPGPLQKRTSVRQFLGNRSAHTHSKLQRSLRGIRRSL